MPGRDAIDALLYALHCAAAKQVEVERAQLNQLREHEIDTLMWESSPADGYWHDRWMAERRFAAARALEEALSGRP
jgi:hypothetical protein